MKPTDDELTAARVLGDPMIKIVEELSAKGDYRTLQDLRDRWKTASPCRSLLADVED